MVPVDGSGFKQYDSEYGKNLRLLLKSALGYFFS